MKKLCLMMALAGSSIATGLFAAPTLPPVVRIEVWANQGWDDPFCSDDPVEIFFRVDECAYLTVYQINPWGGVDIIYPRPHHRWIAVLPKRTYSLSDLASDLDLYYDGAQGTAHLGIIATHDPIDVVPWVEAGFRNCGFAFGRPVSHGATVEVNVAIERIHADLRFRLGTYCEPTFFSRVIYLRPRPARPPVVIHRRRPEIDIWGRWGSRRSYSPPPTSYGKRDSDVRYRDAAPDDNKQRTMRKSNNAPSSERRKESAKDRRTRKPD
jgi:hypothetical protein